MFEWAQTQGKGVEFLSTFLRMAWFERVNTNRQSGLRRVVEASGLDWQEARRHLADTGWEERIEANRRSMYSLGLWGVPSYRLLDREGKTLLSTWGQDRLWLVARTIQNELQSRAE